MIFTILTCMVASAFILHDFEEIIVMEAWLNKNEKDLFNVLPKRFHGYFKRVFPRSTLRNKWHEQKNETWHTLI